MHVYSFAVEESDIDFKKSIISAHCKIGEEKYNFNLYHPLEANLAGNCASFTM